MARDIWLQNRIFFYKTTQMKLNFFKSTKKIVTANTRTAFARGRAIYLNLVKQP